MKIAIITFITVVILLIVYLIHYEYTYPCIKSHKEMFTTYNAALKIPIMQLTTVCDERTKRK